MARTTIIQRRRTTQAILLVAMLLAIPVILAVESRFGRNSQSIVNVAAGIGAITIIGIMVFRELSAGRRLAALIKSDWQRCLYCFFDLRGLTHHGDCPECGQHYDIEQVRRTWRHAMRPEAEGRGERMAEAD